MLGVGLLAFAKGMLFFALFLAGFFSMLFSKLSSYAVLPVHLGTKAAPLCEGNCLLCLKQCR